MITRIVKLTIAPEFMADFLSYFNNIKSAIRSSPGCRHLEVLRSRQDERMVFTLSKWDDEAHLGNYLHSERFRKTWSVVKPMFDESAQAWTLEQLEEVLPSNII
jgi:heme-degrading monooxygenase HmoA